VGGEGGGGVGVEQDQRDNVGPPVADGHYLGDQRAGGQHGVFDVGRGHVLARRVDDQLFLAVDDPHVAVVIDGGDVAGVQPPVRIDGFGGLGGGVLGGPHHPRAAGQPVAVAGPPPLPSPGGCVHPGRP